MQYRPTIVGALLCNCLLKSYWKLCLRGGIEESKSNQMILWTIQHIEAYRKMHIYI